MAWSSPPAGERRERVRFEKRAAAAGDGYGNSTGDWAVICPDRLVRLRPLRGGEGVQAARMTGTAQFELVVASDSLTRLVDSDCRVVDVRTLVDDAVVAGTTRTFNVRFAEDPEGDGVDILMQLEAGGVDG